MEITEGFKLGAGVKGKDGCFYYCFFQDGDAGDKTSVRQAFLVHAKLDGSCVKKAELDCGEDCLNIYEWSEGCTLEFNGSCISIHVTRRMVVSPDGLNHQAARIA